MNQERPEYFFSKSTFKDVAVSTRGESDKLSIYMTAEQAMKLANRLMELAEANPHEQLKLTAYTSVKTNGQTGEEFFSTTFTVLPKVTATGPLNPQMEARAAQRQAPASGRVARGPAVPAGQQQKPSPPAATARRPTAPVANKATARPSVAPPVTEQDQPEDEIPF